MDVVPATAAGIPLTLSTAPALGGCPGDGTHFFSSVARDSCLCGIVKILPATTYSPPANARIDDMSWPTL